MTGFSDCTQHKQQQRLKISSDHLFMWWQGSSCCCCRCYQKKRRKKTLCAAREFVSEKRRAEFEWLSFVRTFLFFSLLVGGPDTMLL